MDEERRRENLMNLNGYLNELLEERRILEPFNQTLPLSFRLLTQEIDRILRSNQVDDLKLESGSPVLPNYGDEDPNSGSMTLEGRSPLPQAEELAYPERHAPSSSLPVSPPLSLSLSLASPSIELPSFPLPSFPPPRPPARTKGSSSSQTKLTESIPNPFPPPPPPPAI